MFVGQFYFILIIVEFVLNKLLNFKYILLFYIFYFDINCLVLNKNILKIYSILKKLLYQLMLFIMILGFCLININFKVNRKYFVLVLNVYQCINRFLWRCLIYWFCFFRVFQFGYKLGLQKFSKVLYKIKIIRF